MADRWAIAAYIRALQYSQNARLADLAAAGVAPEKLRKIEEDAREKGARVNRDNIAARSFAAPAAVDRIQRLGLIVGAVGAVLCAIGFFVSPEYFFRSWLVGWVYWMGVTLGCFALFMLHHLTRGGWGLVIRRVMEAASRTLPWLALLALPILLDLVFTKTSTSGPARRWSQHDALLQAKAPYLNVPVFLVRLVLYFLIWGCFAFILNRMSLRQDTSNDPGLTRRMQLIAAFGPRRPTAWRSPSPRSTG